MPVERESLSQNGFERRTTSSEGRLAVISLIRWPKLEVLREKLNGKAKAKPKYRFYTLYDKVYRMDFLEAAYAQCRVNKGASGVDEETFEDIEKYGVTRYLAELSDELKGMRYRPQAVRRVLIPKANQPGKFRPLGIPTIRDRIVQQAVKLLLEPIFEADFTDNAYGYRAGKSAQDAVLKVDKCLHTGQVNVVDGDLSKYFDTIPHDELMKSVQRRIADKRIMWLIRSWLRVPVQERRENGKVDISGGKDNKVGTPQGGVISPLLANIYFRRFLVAWQTQGYAEKYQSQIVNYADDFVILCRGSAQAAKETAGRILAKIGLKLNTTKTRVMRAWNESFDFLGYTFGKLYAKGGKEYLGLRPSDKSAGKYRERIRELTARNQTLKSADAVAEALNRTTRGYWNYFKCGTVSATLEGLDKYLWDRTHRWAKCKYTRSRGGHGQAARQTKMQAAWKKVKNGRRILGEIRAKEPLFARAASYAQ
jgi:RNA-directed DNA polymerase